ncbi:Wadjet anti-phage system protein JetA family protein [Agarilytica rhodophyticola]|uniref:Wadjet anti-phage system protein JetA family protein n=1 Tax=Agarilytica rhodophyticola TaxID=1737490 RepID=UPI000B34886B|nr:Wadjet anti-phage system protein JetA family protein [Agarilytica rhodophyticola]
MFFSDERFHFFRPLTSKYREQAVQCLGLFYQRQYSSHADYGQSLNREQVIEIFEEALTLSANQVLENNDDDDQEQRFKNTREHSTWMLKQFLECGWIERQVDSATLQSTFPFTRMGRVFSQALIESSNTQIRTRHRNTRNTLNALEAFLSRGEIYDLLDAYEYSERIITDFTDVISELEERKRELVREVESQQLVHQATDQFFDFMEKRFQPDISVRLSADSVEKHRADIDRAINKIRRKQKSFKRDIEKELRRTVPGICSDEKSYLWHILDTIERRMRNAAEVMLPALRNALHSFTKRADIIIRQLSYLSSQADSDLVEVCKELADLSDQDYNSRLQKAAAEMAVLKLQLIDPKQVRLQERRQRESVDSSVGEQHSVDQGAQRELMAQQLLDQAFVINNEKVRAYLIKSLRDGQSISTKDLPITNAKDLLALAHVIEVGAVNTMSSDFIFKVEPTGNTITEGEFYHSRDEFTIELIDNTSPKADKRASADSDLAAESK